MVPETARGVVRCFNHDKGAAAHKICGADCIGCMKCTKVCEHGAIQVQDSLASISVERCIGCGICADNGPAGCITIFGHETAKNIKTAQ